MNNWTFQWLSRFYEHNFIILILCCLWYTGGQGQQVENSKIGSNQVAGRELSNRYCASCHKFPEPELLDKETWKHSVLPNMALRLGLKMAGKYIPVNQDSIEVSLLKQYNTYPENPLISKEDWSKIEAYYLENAPKKLPLQLESSVKSINEFPFQVQSINIDDVKLPQVTLLEYNSHTSELYIGNYLKLYALKNDGTLSGEWTLDSYASDIEFSEKEENPLLLSIGKLVPSNQKLGTLDRLDTSGTSNTEPPIFSELQRPVNFESADLNMDGKTDLVLCSFGHTVGKLSWFDNYDASKEHVLSTQPGTRKIEIADFNNDGKPDIMVLMTQSYEGIKIFYNEGENKFREEQVLKFPPVHGLSYFELADFNKDSHLDILMTNGDNRDFSPINKPYHGVRIYMNDTKNNFKETYFFPMYDCNKAMARDFDGDGDLDIIAASLFVNYEGKSKVQDAVVYLTNNGGLNFEASLLPNPSHANWLTMEVADFNRDGLLDVILGAFVYDINEMFSIISATGISNLPQILLLTQKK
ncbi:FG-GAP repeat domain-containing protein [Maribacter aestuarii]|uniref:FG-GAP repeat domain-containing protein n=1 Tax=Maribacter aestuarii TaxID=1130723 RepID=UPI00248BBB38|nr:VCBS repeat-containing protein [Maribacter aestuarii]